MKRVQGLILTFLLTGLICQSRAADPIPVDPFHSIIVSSGIVTEIIPSEKESIEVEFKNADKNDLIAEVADSVLKVRMKTGNYKNASLKIRINYRISPRLLEASGRAQIWSTGEIHQANDLKVELSNGGEMRMTLYCDSISATLSKGSVIHLKGKTRALKVKATTNATFSGYEFESETADVLVNTTGKAKVSVRKYLNASAASKGFIGYIGEPERVNENTSLKGEIMKARLE